METSFQENDVCSICLDEDSEIHKMNQISCGHLFHDECINSWISDHLTCPLCLQTIPFVIKLRYKDVIVIKKPKKFTMDKFKKDIKQISNESSHIVPIELDNKHINLNGITIDMEDIYSMFCAEKHLCIIHNMTYKHKTYVKHILYCNENSIAMKIFFKIQNNCERLRVIEL